MHQGFYNAYSVLRSNVEEYIANIMKNNNGNFTLDFVGHSLGGALATFAAI